VNKYSSKVYTARVDNMRYGRAGSIIPMVKNLTLFFAAILIVLTGLFAGQLPNKESPYITVLSSEFYYEKGRNITQKLAEMAGSNGLKSILKTEMPVLAIVDDKGKKVPPNGLLLSSCVHLFSGIKLDDPLTYLKAEIPMMDVTPVTADSFDETAVDEVTEKPSIGSEDAEESFKNPQLENKVISHHPLIGLYNTHTSETFELTDGLTHLKGKAGGVTIVTREVQKILNEQYGIPTVYSDNIHDKVFSKSYVESEKTVKQLIKDNPEMVMLFDIHRDGALTREQTIAKVNGQTAAKILFVVGTDARAEHPHWRENLKLARKIAAKMDSMYPGLSRGIAIKQGRYNQHHHPGALLVEIGSEKNTTEEAVISGRFFANVVVAVLNDMYNEGKIKTVE